MSFAFFGEVVNRCRWFLLRLGMHAIGWNRGFFDFIMFCEYEVILGDCIVVVVGDFVAVFSTFYVDK